MLLSQASSQWEPNLTGQLLQPVGKRRLSPPAHLRTTPSASPATAASTRTGSPHGPAPTQTKHKVRKEGMLKQTNNKGNAQAAAMYSYRLSTWSSAYAHIGGKGRHIQSATLGMGGPIRLPFRHSTWSRTCKRMQGHAIGHRYAARLVSDGRRRACPVSGVAQHSQACCCNGLGCTQHGGPATSPAAACKQRLASVQQQAEPTGTQHPPPPLAGFRGLAGAPPLEAGCCPPLRRWPLPPQLWH